MSDKEKNANTNAGVDKEVAAKAAADKKAREDAAKKAAAAEEKRKADEKKAAEKAEAARVAAEKKAAEKAEREAKRKAEAEEKAKAKEAEKAEREAAKKAKAEEKAKEAEERKAAREASKMPEQNGVRRPKPETKCGKVWQLIETIGQQMGQVPPIAYVMQYGQQQGFDDNTLKTQYARWKKFNGHEGRVAAPVIALNIPNVAAEKAPE